jgi:hypothetical protein
VEKRKLIDIHNVGDTHEIGEERLKNARNKALLEAGEEGSVANIHSVSVNSRNALNEPVIEKKAIVWVSSQIVQKLIYQLFILLPLK